VGIRSAEFFDELRILRFRNAAQLEAYPDAAAGQGHPLPLPNGPQAAFQLFESGKPLVNEQCIRPAEDRKIDFSLDRLLQGVVPDGIDDQCLFLDKAVAEQTGIRPSDAGLGRVKRDRRVQTPSVVAEFNLAPRHRAFGLHVEVPCAREPVDEPSTASRHDHAPSRGRRNRCAVPRPDSGNHFGQGQEMACAIVKERLPLLVAPQSLHDER
jgi:hypothetical protein